MHEVRDDPEKEGLLYAGTWYGAFVSFDKGKHWQSLQQNLPATAVTDLKVHHGDLLASTMGRSFWIMDDVAPLRQIAASVMKTARPRATESPNPAVVVHDVTATRDRVVLASQDGAAPSKPATKAPASALPRLPIKPFDKSNVFLFTPAAAYRMHYPSSSGRPDFPEYPPIGARIDYWVANPSGDLKLEILEPTGKIVRSSSSKTLAAASAPRRPGA